MVDDVILGKAAITERCLQRIHDEYVGHEDALETDFTRQDAIVLNVQRACEASIDLAMHLVRIHHLGLPQDARQAFTALADANQLSPEIARRLQAMVGFRNVAVHRYQELSLPILRAILDTRLSDFTDFTRQVLRTD